MCFFTSEEATIGFTGFTSACCCCPVAASKVLGFSTQVIQYSAAFPPTPPTTHTHTTVMKWPLMSRTLPHYWNPDVICVLDDWPPLRLSEFEAALVHVRFLSCFCSLSGSFYVSPTVSPFVHYLCMLSSKPGQCVAMFGFQSDSLIWPRGRRATTTDEASRRWPI